jgi:hypothetical protein
LAASKRAPSALAMRETQTTSSGSLPPMVMESPRKRMRKVPAGFSSGSSGPRKPSELMRNWARPWSFQSRS